MKTKFELSEEQERSRFKQLSKMIKGISDIEFSQINSNARWDVKYRIGDKWFIGDIKVVHIASNELYPLSQQYGIEHLIKKHKIEGLFNIFYNQPRVVIEEFHTVKYETINPMIPVFIYIFSDNKMAIWDLTKLGITWDNFNKSIIEDNDFIEIEDKKTEMGDQSKTINKYYKYLDIRLADLYQSNNIKERPEDVTFYNISDREAL